MAVITGAAKGLVRGIVLFVAVTAIPGFAWLVAALAQGFLGMGFLTIFFVVLGLEAALLLPILFGIASEVQKSHAEQLDRVSRE